jgi:fructokinase
VNRLIGAVELGGTKFICAVANDNLEVLVRVSIETTTPEVTLGEVAAFFKGYKIEALALGAFGPVDINPASAHYGTILATPKLDWQQVNIRNILASQLGGIPIVVQTDVNVAAYGEAMLGASGELASLLYLTIGTGVGGGYVADGKFLPTLLHQEMGHLKIARHAHDTVAGICPFHGDCLEGLASGYAIEKRIGRPAATLTASDSFWLDWASYVASALASYTYTLSPHCIVLGGGVMQQDFLFPLIRQQFIQQIAGYIPIEDLVKGGIDSYIRKPMLAGHSGMMGALLLAKELLV